MNAPVFELTAQKPSRPKLRRGGWAWGPVEGAKLRVLSLGAGVPWSAVSGHVCFIGLNPSIADHRVDDPTVRRWIHFARAWGYGGFTAVNLYPFRSAAPAECRAWSRWDERGPDWYARDALHFANLPIVVREAKAASLTVACWGAGVWDDLWVDHVIEEITTGPAPWPDLFCLGRTAAGDPIHPMARGRQRVPDDAVPRLYVTYDGAVDACPSGAPTQMETPS